ncbi:hypothetical protein [Bifidobacterium myosotis]|uniref:Uncharacterized protein n=1 Tax=Bifidobacterium myosotis TaxID=1630166 RepID=A0A5M9ZG14_9BIFI|nr:hypothetical protein [Bifidobacterium myosotis]KAA8825380.1 hypothetical protein EMO91_12510 [Bifidobacterium myosotis]
MTSAIPPLSPVLLLATDRLDDLVWRTIGLERDMPYSAVRSVVRANIAPPGRPVAETERIYALYSAFRGMLARSRHPLAGDDVAFYAACLGSAAPQPASVPADGWGALRALWPSDRSLAVVCCNHGLIHEGTGVFVPAPAVLAGLDAMMAADDRKAFLEECVSLPGTGLTWTGEGEAYRRAGLIWRP